LVDQIRQKLKTHQSIVLGEEHDSRKRAAVLVPIIHDKNEQRLLLTERAGSLSSHGGEVAFPGGKEDATDSSLEFTALRENQEELNIHPSTVEVIGELRPFISKYGLLVTPFVGVLSPGTTYLPNEGEIASVFEVPLSFFDQAEPIRVDDLTRHGERHLVPVYEFEGYEIWGLTAMIINEFLGVIHRTR
jgi:8-oxo-dGTP pyrophosphatase MutT (NUDIX family)